MSWKVRGSAALGESWRAVHGISTNLFESKPRLIGGSGELPVPSAMLDQETECAERIETRSGAGSDRGLRGSGSRDRSIQPPLSARPVTCSGARADWEEARGRAAPEGIIAREVRRRVTIPAQIREVPGGPLRSATVHNTSSQGMMISGAAMPTTGRIVEVIRGGLALTGRVVWSAPDRCGI